MGKHHAIIESHPFVPYESDDERGCGHRDDEADLTRCGFYRRHHATMAHLTIGSVPSTLNISNQPTQREYVMSYAKVYESKNEEFRAESADYLRELFPPGSEVRTIVKHVSRSGMTRSIIVLAYDPHNGTADSPGRNVDVSHHVARVLGWRWDNNRGGVEVGGCGMDMCFHLVYSLARTLYRDTADEPERAGYLLTSRVI